MKIKGYMIISLLIVVFFLVLEEDVSANGQLEFELAMSIYPRQGLASEIEKLESEIEERVGTCEDYFELGKLYLQNLDFEKAEASFDEVLRLDPESMDYREEIARFYIEKMMFSKAVEIYLELGEIDPSAKGKYYTEIAKIYENRRNFDRALEYWQKVVESEESNPKLHIQLAEEYIRNERYEEAQAEYRRAIELAPDNYDYRLKLAKFYETHKRYEEAISQYEAILSRDKFNEDGLRNLFNLLVNLAELEEIFSELKQKVAGDPADSPSLLRLAQIYEYKGEHLKASIEYKNWAKVDPEGGSRWLEVGDIFIRLRMFAEASRVFMKVLLEYPDRWDERALFGLNESYLYQFTPLDTVLAEGDLLPGFMDENSEPDLLGGAVSVLFSNLQDPLQDFGVMRNRYFNQALGIEGMKRFIAEYPESDLGDDAYLKIATAYYEMRRFSEAIAEYRILLEEYPHPKFDDLSLLGVKRGNYSSVSTEDMDPAGLVLMRIADCYEQMKRYREAIATYRTILERFSTDETQRKLRREALDSIIDIYTRQKRYQEAVSEYKEEIRRDRSPELYKKLGNYVKSNLGYFAAIEVYEEAQAEFSESLDFVRSLGWLYIYNNYDQKAVDLY